MYYVHQVRKKSGALRLRLRLLLLLQAKLPFRLTKEAGKAWRRRPQAGGASMLKLPLPLPTARSTALAGGASMLRPPYHDSVLTASISPFVCRAVPCPCSSFKFKLLKVKHD